MSSPTSPRGTGAPSRYVVLLRGINVGGRNRVLMKDLRAAFEAEGFGQVTTYIQSGNVLLSASPDDGAIEARIETALATHLGMGLVVVARTHDELARIVGNAPDGFGASPETYHSDVVFLKEPLTSAAAITAVRRRDGVDEAWPGDGVLYFRRVSARRTQSRLSTIVAHPSYQQMTIRSWATTTTLLALLDEGSD